MPQILFLAILIGGGWLLYRKFVNDAEKLARLRRAKEKERQTGAIGTLVKDPVTGEYRVKREDEE
ncbi:hypothetical protein ASD54_02995 [Rhizobium sp. Root149]|jgi:membrane protein implicated in regulation of membrane protease activity|uniref:Membrane protein implicated in regulation of membrane protease activity n=1 Tax=Rhizobium rhizoryzae TaxID=451876 RepID=A0A7W6LEU2_9HYPH|nr:MULTISPECIES: hypothetical protein [Rhizobium]KQZ63340.1 hypothetical protein ASD54_02995 [Rhizobium sp. Root149]MBB4143028.1 membrane protein implicated in regulation of membrane protease activity [Rhizobium rhizoryzae]